MKQLRAADGFKRRRALGCDEFRRCRADKNRRSGGTPAGRRRGIIELNLPGGCGLLEERGKGVRWIRGGTPWTCDLLRLRPSAIHPEVVGAG